MALHGGAIGSHTPSHLLSSNNLDEAIGEGNLRKTQASEMRKKLVKRLFTANYLIIKAFRIHYIVILALLLMTYLQTVYFAFFNVNISNIDPAILDWRAIEVYFALMNYQKLFLAPEQGSLSTFYAALLIHLCYYCLLIVLSIFVVGRKHVFRSEISKELSKKQMGTVNYDKDRDVDDDDFQAFNQRDKRSHNVSTMELMLSLGVTIGQTVLVIPTTQLAIAVFSCDILSQIDQVGFVCLDVAHIVMICVTLVLSALALSFMVVEALLFQNPDTKGALPWRGVPSRLSLLKLITQVACVLFNFSSITDVTPVSQGVLVALSGFILYKRYKNGLRYYWRPYLYLMIFTESTVFWFALWNFVSIVTKASMTAYAFIFLVIICGLGPFNLITVYTFTKRRYDRILLNQMLASNNFSEKNAFIANGQSAGAGGSGLRSAAATGSTEEEAELYFGYLLDMIKAQKKEVEARVVLFGIVRAHWYQCKKRKGGEECLCMILVQKVGSIHTAVEDRELQSTDAFDLLLAQQQEIVHLEDKMAEQDLEEQRVADELERLRVLDMAQDNVNQLDTEMQNIVTSCSSAAGGDIETLEKLLQSGADLNRGDYDNRTPLHLAAATGHLRVVKFLIEKAEVNSSPADRWGATPLNDAKAQEIQEYLHSVGAMIGEQQKEYQEMISANVSNEQCRLYFAAFHGDVLLMKNLFILGKCKVNDYDYDGRTALSIAASEGHLEAVKFLIVNNADFNHKDSRNNTAIDDARREKRGSVIAFLEKVSRQRENLHVFKRNVFYESGEQVLPVSAGGGLFSYSQGSPLRKDISQGGYQQEQLESQESAENDMDRVQQVRVDNSLMEERANALRGSKPINYEKEIKVLLYRFIYEQLEDAIACTQSLRLKYLAAYMQYRNLRNDIRSLFQFLLIEKQPKIPFEWRFFVYKVKIEIEDRMDNATKKSGGSDRLNKRSTGSKATIDVKIDIQKVYLFSKTLQVFINELEITSDKCLDFWRELLKKADFNSNNFHRIGTQVAIGSQHISRLVNSLMQINPHYGFLLRAYSIFLLRVLNNEDDGDLFARRSLNSEKTFIQQERRGTPLTEDLQKYFAGDCNYLIVVIRVNTSNSHHHYDNKTDTAGIVEEINNEVYTLLGYHKEEVRGHNIAKLMPPAIGVMHDQFIRRYLETAETRFINDQREVFLLRKNGYMMQAFVYATVVPIIEQEGLKFVGFIKRVDERSHTQLLPPPAEFAAQKSITFLAAPNGNILGISEQASKILGLPNYFAIDSDESLSDFNLSTMIKGYNVTILKCFKQCPKGQVSVIDTEVFRPLLVQDLHSRSELRRIERRLGRYQVHIQATPVEYGGSLTQFKNGGKSAYAYLPLVIFRMYVIARLQQVSKAFFRKDTQIRTGGFQPNFNAGVGSRAAASRLSTSTSGKEVFMHQFRWLILSQLEKAAKTGENKNQIQVYSQRRDSVPINFSSSLALGSVEHSKNQIIMMRGANKIKGMRLLSKLKNMTNSRGGNQTFDDSEEVATFNGIDTIKEGDENSSSSEKSSSSSSSSSSSASSKKESSKIEEEDEDKENDDEERKSVYTGSTSKKEQTITNDEEKKTTTDDENEMFEIRMPIAKYLSQEELLKTYGNSDPKHGSLAHEDDEQPTPSPSPSPDKKLVQTNHQGSFRAGYVKKDLKPVSNGKPGVVQQQKLASTQGNFRSSIEQRRIDMDENDYDDDDQESSASISSSYGSISTQELAKLREFRKMVTSRQEPQTVIFLRKMVLVMMAVMFAILSVDTALKINFYKSYQSLHTLKGAIEEITLDMLHVHSGFRTLINIHNGIQPDEIKGLVSNGLFSQEILEKVSDYLNSLNVNKNVFLIINPPQEVEDIYSRVAMKVILSDGTQETQYGNLNLALGQIIAKGSDLLNYCKLDLQPFKNRTFIDYINQLPAVTRGSNSPYLFGKLGNDIDEVTKGLFYLQENIFDEFTTVTDNMQSALEKHMLDYIHQSETTTVVLVLSVFVITLVSTVVIFKFVRQTEYARIESLSLYSEVYIEDVQSVIDDIVVFIRQFRDDHIVLQLRKSGVTGVDSDNEGAGGKRRSVYKENSIDGEDSPVNHLSRRYNEEDEDNQMIKELDMEDEEQMRATNDENATTPPTQDNKKGFFNRISQSSNNEPQSPNTTSKLGLFSALRNVVNQQQKQNALQAAVAAAQNRFQGPLSHPVGSPKTLLRLQTSIRKSILQTQPDFSLLQVPQKTQEQSAKISEGNELEEDEFSESSNDVGDGGEKQLATEEEASRNTAQAEQVDHKQIELDVINESGLSERGLAADNDQPLTRQKKQASHLNEVDNPAPPITLQEYSNNQQNKQEPDKVGNIEKFKMVESRSGFRTLTAVALLFVFPAAYVLASVSLSVPFFTGLSLHQEHETLLITGQLALYYKIYLQVVQDLATGTSQAASDIKDPDLLKLPYYHTQYDYLQGLKFDNWQSIQAMHFKHSQALSKVQEFVQRLDTSEYCSLIKDGDASVNMTFCETVDNGVAKDQGIHIQLERVFGEIAKIRNAFERRPMNLTVIFKDIIPQDQTLARFQLMMDRLITPTYYVLRRYLQSEKDRVIDMQQKIDTAMLAALVVLHLSLIVAFAWPRFLRSMTSQISQSRGILTLIPSRFIIKNPSIKGKVLSGNSRLLAN